MEVMWRVVLTGSLLCWGLSSSEITCKDKNGAAVDWYILYKVPKLNNRNLKGLEYFYISAAGMEWQSAINDPKGVLAHTLEPLLTPPPNFGFISYNDQPPGCNADPLFGHSKGIVMMDKATGVWLLHSTPNLPYHRKQKVLWPETGAKYAQTFICVTVASSQFDKIGKHLQYIRAFPFDYDLPPGFPSVFESVVKREDLHPNKPFLVQELTSKGGQKFKSFAKYSQNIMDAKDLYFYIAKDLNSDLSVRSWRGSTETVTEVSDSDSDCSQEGKVVDTVEDVTMTITVAKKRVKISWTDCQDHSKWCVAESKPWTCIGDLNKAFSQDKRPGGAICIEKADVQQDFKSFIEYKTDCPDRKP